MLAAFVKPVEFAARERGSPPSIWALKLTFCSSTSPQSTPIAGCDISGTEGAGSSEWHELTVSANEAAKANKYLNFIMMVLLVF